MNGEDRVSAVPGVVGPKVEPMRCGVKMVFGDDYGDNDCTIRCQLPLGHDGPHVETGRGGPDWKFGARNYCISWQGADE